MSWIHELEDNCSHPDMSDENRIRVLEMETECLIHLFIFHVT